MNIIKVASKSSTSAVAGAIAHSVRDNNQAHVQAIGAGAVNQAVKATIMAKRFLAEEGNHITFSPDFVEVMINGKERTAVRFSVNGVFKEATVAELNVSAPLPEETPLDHLAASADAAAVRAQADSYTMDDDIADDFAQRQGLAYSGRQELLDKLESHNAESPILSGGDIDAAWDQSMVGEETVGGMNPTPDQDVVAELGEAVGLTYEDDEPLNTAEKLERRDEKRWELNPASAQSDPDKR